MDKPGLMKFFIISLHLGNEKDKFTQLCLTIPLKLKNLMSRARVRYKSKKFEFYCVSNIVDEIRPTHKMY